MKIIPLYKSVLLKVETRVPYVSQTKWPPRHVKNEYLKDGYDKVRWLSFILENLRVKIKDNEKLIDAFCTTWMVCSTV